jgi:ribosomal protein S1
VVDGKVLKVNPFGLFVELDPEIHGLAHVSELELAAGERIESKIKPNDVLKFKIISLEPESHRLGLSQKALNRPDVVPGEEKKEEAKEEKAPEVKAEEAPAVTEEKAAE